MWTSWKKLTIIKCILHGIYNQTLVSVQGVKSLGGHLACLCRGFDFYEVKKYCYYNFTKRKGKYLYTFNHFCSAKSSKRANSTNLLVWPQSAGINMQSPQSDLHAIWSYNEHWDFPTAGSSLFLPWFSLLTFLRFLAPFFIFSEIFTSGVL